MKATTAAPILSIGLIALSGFACDLVGENTENGRLITVLSLATGAALIINYVRRETHPGMLDRWNLQLKVILAGAILLCLTSWLAACLPDSVPESIRQTLKIGGFLLYLPTAMWPIVNEWPNFKKPHHDHKI